MLVSGTSPHRTTLHKLPGSNSSCWDLAGNLCTQSSSTIQAQVRAGLLADKMGGARLHCSSQCMSRNSMPTYGTSQYHHLRNLHIHHPMCSSQWMAEPVLVIPAQVHPQAKSSLPSLWSKSFDQRKFLLWTVV